MVSDITDSKKDSVKFLCSYGGKIVPRSTDGTLRYVGGLTRVLAVDRSICYAELMVKLGEFCGYSVELRCQLPDGDLETLISIKSDEELNFIKEEYNQRCPGKKIRAILTPPKSLKIVSPPPSTPSSIDLSPTKYKSGFHGQLRNYYYSPTTIGYPDTVYSRFRPDNYPCCCNN